MCLHWHPDKCALYAREIPSCGRLICAKGWRFDPRNVEGPNKMQEPSNGASKILMRSRMDVHCVAELSNDRQTAVGILGTDLQEICKTDQTRMLTDGLVSLEAHGWSVVERAYLKVFHQIIFLQVTL